MKNLLLAILLAVMLCACAQAQTQEELEQEFIAVAESSSTEELGNYANWRLAGATAASVAEAQAFTIFENSFGSSPCLQSLRANCDRDYHNALINITTTSTAAGVVCLAGTAAGGPLLSGLCLAAVVLNHIGQLAIARNSLTSCYVRARRDCPPPTPTPTPQIIPIAGGGGPSLPPIIPCFDGSADPCDTGRPRSPIMIDVAGDGFHLTGARDGVMFDLSGQGAEQLSWSAPNSDDAFLALDRDGNGLIDNGAELFGNFTDQPDPAPGQERNGFAALAVFDSNRDRAISNSDAVFWRLRLWQDLNHNGISEPDELHLLGELGLAVIDLNYERSKEVDEFGNEFRYRAEVKDENGAQLGRWAWDVFFTTPMTGGMRR